MNFRRSQLLFSLLVGVLLSVTIGPAFAVASLTQKSAFSVAFGQASPLMRTVRSSSGHIDYRLHPRLLVRLSGTRSALIVAEDTEGGNASAGAIAIAYLTSQSDHWRLSKIRYEFIQGGSFGKAFINYRTVNSSIGPLFVGESENAGTGAITTWYNLIGLYPDGPIALGSVHARGVFNSQPGEILDGDGSIGCGGYAYSSVISAPQKRSNLMQVTYSGWMLPGGMGQKRHKFLISETISSKNGKLVSQPPMNLPNCGD